MVVKYSFKILRFLLVSVVVIFSLLLLDYSIEDSPFKDQRLPGQVLKVRPADDMELPAMSKFLLFVYLRAAEIFGYWDTPMPTDGRFENMQLKDKAYWLYKAQIQPVMHPEQGSNFTAYFKENPKEIPAFPESFLPQDTLHFSAAGDLLPNPLIAASGIELYRDVADVLFADLSLANLESPVVDKEENAFEISAEKSPLLYLNHAQFNVISGYADSHFSVLQMANNHTLDFGPEGVMASLNALQRKRITPLGIHGKGAQPATLIEQNGFKVGLVAATFGLNGKTLPESSPLLVDVADMNNSSGMGDIGSLQKQIAWCRAEGCDMVIASLHWGVEFEFYPREVQVLLAHRLAEMGVDAIIGHHPHVVQPMELYRPKSFPEKVVPVFYSLGNLTSPVSMPATALSGIANITFVKGRLNGKTEVYVSDVRFIPVIQLEITAADGHRVVLQKLSQCQTNPACREAKSLSYNIIN